jgi:DNA (cytosine-5)-methyltransferase 1
MNQTMPRALDLFCGAGGAAMGLHRAGFTVTGVDIEYQPNYPFEFIKGDATDLRIEWRRYDFIWASPPCQAYTNAQRIRGNEHPDFIASTREWLQRIWYATGAPWCIENVVGAPLNNPILLCGTMFGLRTYRHRLFECSFPITAPQHGPHMARNQKMGRPVKDGEYMHVVGNFSGARLAREIMGIDWMTRDELREAIPPAYSEFIGRAALKHCRSSIAA